MDIWKNKPLLALIVGAGSIASVAFIGLVGWLVFGYFGIQAAFLDDEVTESGPVFDSGATAEVLESQEFQDAMEEAEEESTTVDDDMMPGDIVTLFSGTFEGNSRYVITGDALVLNDGTEQRFLRFENFEASNGPDLSVYLRAEDGSFEDLGELKGNIGDQNYEIPAGVDLEVYNSVEIWCVRFSVGFGQAELTA